MVEDRVLNDIEGAERILIGIGEEWQDKKDVATKGYGALCKLVENKDYYIISLCNDGVIEETGFDASRLCTPNDENDDKWTAYNEWLGRTLNRKLCILELGVGLKYPDVIRWPFEKIAFINNKARMYRINERFYQTTEELGSKCVGIQANPMEYIL